MFCGFCGEQVPAGARFCQNCGGQCAISPIPASPVSSQVPQAIPRKNKSRLRAVGSVLIFCALGLFALVIWVARQVTETPEREVQNQSDLSTQPNSTISKPQEKPISPAEMKAAQKILREKWAEETQKDLWRQGMEMTFQARGTTLYIKYVLAGEAFAFQFHEGFLSDNAETLRGLGFKTVELSNGDNVWSWKL